MKIVAVSAGAANPSSTRKLTDRVLAAVAERLPNAEIRVIDVREFGQDLLTATTSGLRSDRLTAALEAAADAAGLIAVTPVFNGSYSGLFKLFFDVLDEGSLANVPVLLGATGGTARHSLAIDQTMVPLFFYLRARPLPWPIYAATGGQIRVAGRTRPAGGGRTGRRSLGRAGRADASACMLPHSR